MEANKMKETILLIGGVICIAFAAFHLSFWKIFDWRKSLSSISQENRAIIYVLNLSVIFFLFVFAYLSIFQGNALISSLLGKTIIILMAAFWIIRAIEQPIFFGFRAKETFIIVVVCLMIGVLYIIPLVV
jgi:hypothetical protein